MLIDRLERRVMRQRTVAQGQPPWVSNAFAGLLAAYHLGREKELLDLLLGKGGLVIATDNADASQPKQDRKSETAKRETRCVH
jgi:hypothetical protein